ncbi:MAG: hypothetical protein ABSG49_05135 [Methanoregula sp.]|jgi:hypothetical protein|uniref:hypothetical protein n=1 Tax=Methanoregula sp. TaxID=2052170 RepID=UPI003C2A759E
MKIQKPEYLKKCSCIGILASIFLVMSLVVAGCVQNSTGNSDQPAAVSTPASGSGNSAPAEGAGSVAPAGTVQQGTGISPSGTYSNSQHAGGNFLTNETRLAAAAQTLGVSESDLKNALTPPAQGRVNLTTAAEQLGVTQDQLTGALGMHAGGPGNGTWQRGGYNATNGRNPTGQ